MSKLITAKQLHHNLFIFYGMIVQHAFSKLQESAALKDLAANVSPSDYRGILQDLRDCRSDAYLTGILPMARALRTLDRRRSKFRGVYAAYLERRFP